MGGGEKRWEKEKGKMKVYYNRGDGLQVLQRPGLETVAFDEHEENKFF